MADCEASTPKKQKYDDHSEMKQDISSVNDSITKPDLLKVADEALQESNKRHVKPVVEESSLGIKLFVGNKKNQYHGLIKARYADFIVHEIDLEGNIVQLTSFDAPEEEEIEEPSNTMKIEDFLDRKALVSLSNVNNGLLDFYRIDVTGMDKEMRTSLHQAIRASYDRLESSTMSESDMKAKQNSNQGQDKPDSTSESKILVDKQIIGSQQVATTTETVEKKTEPPQIAAADNDKKYIMVTKRGKASRPKNVWPSSRADYTHFVLYKENKDTMDAIHNVAAATNSKPSSFSYAGTKDRRAVTSQWISSWRLEPRRLISAMRRFNKRPYIKVGNFCFKKEPIKLGQLTANKFDIVIRHLVHNSDGIKVIETEMNTIRDQGFINYFGLQRFGTRSIQTHEVGLAILQVKWETAVDLILSYRYDDRIQPLSNAHEEERQADLTQERSYQSEANKNQRGPPKQWASEAEKHNICIDLWKSNLDADLVFKKCPQFRATNEGMIIKSLSKSIKNSNPDYFSAITSLPRNVRSMYVHSYQSIIWNKLTTYRLERHGFNVIPGDLILSPDAKISDVALDALLTADDTEKPDAIKLDEIEELNADLKEMQKTTSPIAEIESKIVIANEENLKNYSIFDVVLPLVGSQVKKPNNEVGVELERLLNEDGLTWDSFKKCERIFVSYGSYRKIVVKPTNLNWTIQQYSHPQENLVETDLDLLNRVQTNKDNSSGGPRPSSPVKSDSTDEALIVSFELPPSSYATMCLREMMKKPSTEFNNRF